MKIDIEIEDISLFAQVAVIVDRPKILKGIVKLRGKWAKGKIYSTVRAWKNEGLKINYQNDIIDLLASERVSPVFLSVIEEAMVTNKVTHFNRVVMVPIPRKVLAEYLVAEYDTYDFGDYEYVLITPMEAERNEVEEGFANGKRAVKKTLQNDNPFEQLLQPLLQNPKTPFRNAREWYWMYQQEKQNGKGTYKRIVERWDKLHQPKEDADYLDQNVIEQAVSRYSKLLKR